MLKVDSFAVFAGLPLEFRQEIEKEMQWKTVDSKKQVVDKADSNDDLIFVQKGRVKIVIHTPSGQEVALDDVDEGEFFGELSGIDDMPRSASVTTLQPSVLAFLPAEKFKHFLKREPEFALRIMQRLVSIIRSSNERIVDLGTLSANSRILAELLRIALKKGEEKDGGIYISPIPKHTEIAARASTARETVARVLNGLAKKNIIAREKKALVIHNIEILSAMVQEEKGED